MAASELRPMASAPLAARGLLRFGGGRLIQAGRGWCVRFAKHGQADDPDIIRPPGPGGVGILQVGKNEVGDAVLRLAPPEDVVRLPGRKDVAALPPGGRFSAHDIDAVHRNDTEDPPGPSASDRNGVAVARSSGDPALAVVRIDRQALTGGAIQDRHVDDVGATGRRAQVVAACGGRCCGARGQQRGR